MVETRRASELAGASDGAKEEEGEMSTTPLRTLRGDEAPAHVEGVLRSLQQSINRMRLKGKVDLKAVMLSMESLVAAQSPAEAWWRQRRVEDDIMRQLRAHQKQAAVLGDAAASPEEKRNAKVRAQAAAEEVFALAMAGMRERFVDSALRLLGSELREVAWRSKDGERPLHLGQRLETEIQRCTPTMAAQAVAELVKDKFKAHGQTHVSLGRWLENDGVPVVDGYAEALEHEAETPKQALEILRENEERRRHEQEMEDILGKESRTPKIDQRQALYMGLVRELCRKADALYTAFRRRELQGQGAGDVSSLSAAALRKEMERRGYTVEKERSKPGSKTSADSKQAAATVTAAQLKDATYRAAPCALHPRAKVPHTNGECAVQARMGQAMGVAMCCTRLVDGDRTVEGTDECVALVAAPRGAGSAFRGRQDTDARTERKYMATDWDCAQPDCDAKRGRSLGPNWANRSECRRCGAARPAAKGGAAAALGMVKSKDDGAVEGAEPVQAAPTESALVAAMEKVMEGKLSDMRTALVSELQLQPLHPDDEAGAGARQVGLVAVRTLPGHAEAYVGTRAATRREAGPKVVREAPARDGGAPALRGFVPRQEQAAALLESDTQACVGAGAAHNPQVAWQAGGEQGQLGVLTLPGGLTIELREQATQAERAVAQLAARGRFGVTRLARGAVRIRARGGETAPVADAVWDSGANVAVVSHERADEWGLPVVGNAELAGVGSQSSATKDRGEVELVFAEGEPGERRVVVPLLSAAMSPEYGMLLPTPLQYAVNGYVVPQEERLYYTGDDGRVHSLGASMQLGN